MTIDIHGTRLVFTELLLSIKLMFYIHVRNFSGCSRKNNFAGSSKACLARDRMVHGGENVKKFHGDFRN